MLPSGTFSEGYGADMAVVRTRLQWGILLASLAVLFTLPLYGSDYVIAVANRLCVVIVAVVGLQVVTGYCGQISLGQAAFMMVGGYGAALLSGTLGLPFWLAIPLSGILAAVLGLPVGAAALRVKGFYLALATMAFHLLIAWIPLHVAALGYAGGLAVPPPKIGNFAFNTDSSVFYVLVVSTVFMVVIAKNIVRSRAGRAFVAIRDNDIAANVMGVNIYYYKMLAFFISCFFAGVAGALWGFWYQGVYPENYSLTQAIVFVGMIIVGGIGSISGAVFGAIFLTLLDEATIGIAPFLSTIGGVFSDLAGVLGLLVSGLVIVLFIIFEPKGLYHRWEIFKASYRCYPFAY